MAPCFTRVVARRTDQDSDGVVSKKELQSMMQKLGNEVTDAEIKDIITESGSSKASGITYTEFQKLMGMGVKNLREPEDPEDELRHAFRLFDQDGDGTLAHCYHSHPRRCAPPALDAPPTRLCPPSCTGAC